MLKIKKIILFTLIALLYLALLGGFAFLAYHQKQESSRQEAERKFNNTPTGLYQLLKTDLMDDRQKIENGQLEQANTSSYWVHKKRYTDIEGIPNEKHISIPSKFYKKIGRLWVKKSELDQKDWKELVRLAEENSWLKHWKRKEKEIDPSLIQKLKNSSNSFIYYHKIPLKAVKKIWKTDKLNEEHHHFWGWDKEKGKIYTLLIPESHPTLALFQKTLEKNQLYLIQGAENLPHDNFWNKKVVKSENQITVTVC